ncbi:hypothetical protein QWT69_15335 [Sporosarcina oncorhynchi]|uniref:Uncharacterized protein n=1 Tax=Sporosarcina oncorhynchi TaxID=3056444 RepID=A0ABZ0L408_9BACL|nr:hypothetical protein [Sporosarcina sp. T2O-4]WOV87210.1 hypothetical protein QWT69_15335 [Sporosarcina sp. T2O-4]
MKIVIIKHFLVMLLFFLLVGLTQTSYVSASKFTLTSPSDELISANGEVQELGGGVGVFLAGILIGYLVDGAIQYTTGHSAADWVAYGLEHLEGWFTGKSYPTGYYITVTAQGNLSICNDQGNCQIESYSNMKQ